MWLQHKGTDSWFLEDLLIIRVKGRGYYCYKGDMYEGCMKTLELAKEYLEGLSSDILS